MGSSRPLPLLLAVALAGTLLAGCAKPGPAQPPFAARDYASGERYARLIVEIDAVQGHEPDDSALNVLKTRIGERLTKPDGTTVEVRTFASGQDSYSVKDLRRLESAHRSHAVEGRTAVLYVLYLDGHSDQDTASGKVLGVHYATTSIAIFKESIRSSGGLPGVLFGSRDVEEAVLVHEFGHAIGLVNNGVPMVRGHEDGEHPGHSTNEQSVMYWAVENTLGLSEFFNSIPDDFDSDDVADLRAAGGK